MDNPYPPFPNLQRGVTDFDIPQHLSLNFSWEIPSPKSQLAASRFLLQGWQLGGIFTAQSGTPFSVKIPADIAGTGQSGVSGNGSGQRPNYNGGVSGCPANGDAVTGNPQNYIMLQCFSVPKAGELGNVGRNTLRGPGLEDFDVSLFKSTNVHGERMKVQFRAELFNVLNHPNFVFREPAIFNSNGAALPVNAAAESPTVATSRQIQLGLKFIF